MQSILENIAKHVSLTSAEEAFFVSQTETKHYPVKTILLSPGKIANCTYFVKSGILRSFNINDNIIFFKEITFFVIYNMLHPIWILNDKNHALHLVIFAIVRISLYLNEQN